MSSTIRFGMVQGRLTQSPPDCLQWFPQKGWQKEFSTASDIGIDYIELIAEVQHNIENPIWTNDGIEQIKRLVKGNGLTLHALCNDYIVEHSFLDEDVIQQNIDLIEQGKKMPISDIAAFLKYKDIDSVKLTCESMFNDGDISYAGNGRYFILTEGADQKKKTKPAQTEISEAENIEKALEKYKSMLDKGLITEEDYNAKKKELLGI